MDRRIEERRRFLRLDANCDVKYAVMASMHAPYNALSKDISGGGLRLPIDKKPRMGELLELEISVPERPLIFAVGRVVWIKKRGAGTNDLEIGVKFMNIDPADREALMDFAVSKK